jgi:deoxyribose-phosphate aldolase
VNIHRMIDHTLLKAQATKDQVEQLCLEAKTHSFRTVCVQPYWVSFCHTLLAGSDTEVCTVVGFPLGGELSSTKAQQAQAAIRDGAMEIDMVINIGAAKSGDWKTVESDIALVAQATGDKILKVILETGYLSDEEISRASLAAKQAGADFVKTSTGFGNRGASLEDIALMRAAVGDSLQIKASGGIRDLEAAKAMIAAGASRLGTSASVAIIQGGAGSEVY